VLPVHVICNASPSDRLSGTLAFFYTPGNAREVEIAVMAFEIDSQPYKVKVSWDSMFTPD